MLLLLLLYFLCALTFTIAKSTLAFSQPIFYVGFRMVAAGIFLLVLYFYQQKRSGESFQPIRKSEWYLFIQIMFLSIYIAYILDLWSLQYITSIESSVIFNLSPFVAAIFSYYWFSEKMTLKKWAGLFIGSISMLPLMIHNNTEFVFFNFNRTIPLCALLISVISSSYGWILIRELILKYKRTPLLINGISMLGGGLFALATSALFESWLPTPVFDWKNFLLYTGAMIVVANFLFSNLYAFLLKSYSATLISFSGFLCPLFTALLGAFFLDEPLGGPFLFSMIGVFLGLILFYKEELVQEKTKKLV